MPRRLIARRTVTSVELCDCGNVYLTVGPVCLNLHPSALFDLRESVIEATRIFLGEGLMTEPTPGTSPVEDSPEGGEVRDVHSARNGDSSEGPN